MDGTLDFVSSGKQGASYGTRVNSFDWNSFYSQLGGGVFLEAVRADMRRNYDYILIDSRTGVSDTGGICTVHLPDTLVVCFTMNNQSIDGAAAVSASIAEQRQEENFHIFPVPTRIEDGEAEKLERRRDYARRQFRPLLKHLPAGKHNVYWGEIEIPYRAFYAYEEVLATFGDRAQVPGSLLSSFERLTNYLTSGAVTSLNPISRRQREQVIAAFEREHDLMGKEHNNGAFSDDSVAGTLWNVPIARNPFFTGREDIIDELRTSLTSDGDGVGVVSHIQAICGLGGIGKNQIAIEYSYRYRDSYQAIFWVSGEGEVEIRKGFLEIAELLDLPEKEAQNQVAAVRAVKRWLEDKGGWLLIFADVDQPEILDEFLPTAPRKGHVVLTSRTQVFDHLGILRPIIVSALPAAVAISFLLTRTGRTTADSVERAAAADLAEELGYLPLALEQAGAFIAETGASFNAYMKSFRQRGVELLASSRPKFGEAEEAITTVWTLNFEEVQSTSMASADILMASAFLSPYGIPFEFLTQGRAELGLAVEAALSNAIEDPLVLADIFKPLSRYSLVQHDLENQTYSLHRLVQSVLRDRMGAALARQWAGRAMLALNRTFPTVTFANWSLCGRLLPHVLSLARFVGDFDLELKEAASLMNEAALYCKVRAHYDDSEYLFKISLQVFEKALGGDHPSVATALGNLASLYRAQGRLEAAEPLYQRALVIEERTLEEDHPAIADSLNNLAVLYRVVGRLEEAEPLYHRALAIKEKSLGSNHPSVADSLNNLAVLYRITGRLGEAETLFRRALAIKEGALGAEHPAIAVTLNDLADLYRIQGRHAEAESLYQKDLKISQQALGPEHPNIGITLNNLANLYRAMDREKEAEPLYRRALEIFERALGPEHLEVATPVGNLAELLRTQGRLEEAEQLYRRSLVILERALDPEHPQLAPVLLDYAALLQEVGRTQEAAETEDRAQKIRARPHFREAPDQ